MDIHLHQHRLFGREQEQRLLLERIAALAAGQGTLALVGGEAGIGKTTLLTWATRQAREHGALVLSGGCYDLSITPPYGPWLEALASSSDKRLPQLPAILQDTGAQGGAASQAELFAALRAWIESAARNAPLVIVLEDLHWADEGSLDALRVVARGIGDAPVLMLTSYRADEVQRGHPLRRMLPLLVRETPSVRLELRHLDDDALSELAATTYALMPADLWQVATYLHEQSGGNPFYAGELLRALAENRILTLDGGYWRLGDLSHVPTPELVRQVIDGRLDRLSTATRPMLELAAVIGHVVPLGIWLETSRDTETALDTAIQDALAARFLELVREGPDLQFVHALVRETLYAAIPPARRRRIHQEIGTALANHARPDPEQVSYHFEQAGDTRAATWRLRAGERALALHANRAAQNHLTWALEHADALAPSERLRAYQARAAARDTVGEIGAARADHHAALALARELGDRATEWRMLLNLGMHWAAQDYARTAAYYREALELAQALHDPLLTARSLNRLGNWELNADRPRLAQRYHEEALETLRILDDRGGIAETLDFLGMAHILNGDLHRAKAVYQEALELYQAAGNDHGVSSVMSSLAECSGTVCNGLLVPTVTIGDAVHHAMAGLALAQELGWRSGECFALFQVGMLHVTQGDYGKAMAALERALRIAEEINHRGWLGGSSSVLAAILLTMQAFEDAETLLERAVAYGRDVGSTYFEAVASCYGALCRVRKGAPDEASAFFEHLPEGSELDSLTTALAWIVLAEQALAVGEPAEALRLADKLLAAIPEATAHVVPFWPGLVRARALLNLGRPTEAETGLRAVVRDAVGKEPAFIWNAHLTLAHLYRKQSRHTEADREVETARAIIAHLATTIPAGRLREQYIARTNAQLATVEGTVEAFAGLTAREQEVLRLLSEGCSDREIAQALSVSPRTASTHVTNILNKLGVNTRTAAAALAIRQGLV